MTPPASTAGTPRPGLPTPDDVVVATLDAEATAGDAVRRAVAASVLRLLRHDPVVRAGGDPEGVHQARVATRRLRSDLSTFAPLLDPDWTESLRSELRDLAASLGTVRDADVLLMRLRGAVDRLAPEEAAAAAGLLDLLARQTEEHRTRLLEVMDGTRYATLLGHLVAAARAPALEPQAVLPARVALPVLVRQPWTRLRRTGRALPQDPTDEQLHDLRIRAKRCRYAAEAVAPVVGPPARELAAAAAGLQEVLGEHHDAVVAAAWLREHAGRGRSAFVAGLLAAAELAAAGEQRLRWRDAWRELGRAHPGSWL